MSPDPRSPSRPSINERLASIDQLHRGSVVARTEEPFTWKQMGIFFACLVAAVALAWSGWHYYRVSHAIGRLKDPDAAVRQQAAEELGRLKSPRALQPLLDALRSDATEHLEAAEAEAEAAGSLGAPALAPLLADLHDDTLTSAASDGLTKVGAPAVDSLIAALADASSDVRWGAARALGGIGATRSVNPLIARLADPEENVREEVASSLGKIKDPRADQPLIAALKDPESGVQRAAGEALGEVGDPQAVNFLLAALRNKDADTVVLAVDFYIRRGDPGSEDALIAALNQAGDEHTAEEFLNSGNEKLKDAANDWASRNNYEIMYLPGAKSAGWGAKP